MYLSDNALPRMRVAKECYQLIHNTDPQSRISERYIRTLAKNGVIPSVKSGNRLLLNYDALLHYLNHAISVNQETGK